MRSLVLALFLAALPTAALEALAQCPGGVCPAQPSYAASAGRLFGRPAQPTPETRRVAPDAPRAAFRYETPAAHKRAIVRIYAFEGATQRSIGSGAVLLWKNRKLILTAWHVVKGAKKLLVVPFKGKSVRARVLSYDPEYDVAVLALAEDLPDVPAAEPEYGEEAVPKKGDRLESCGYGPDGTLAVNSGLLLRYTRPSTRSVAADWMVISGRARGGDSGGPVFNARGRLVGVLWGTDNTEVLATQSGRLQIILNSAEAKLPAPSPVVVLPVPAVPPRIAAPAPPIVDAETQGADEEASVPVPMPEADAPLVPPVPTFRPVPGLTGPTMALEVCPSGQLLDKLRQRRNPAPPHAQPAPPSVYVGPPTSAGPPSVYVGPPTSAGPPAAGEEQGISAWWLALFIPLSLVTVGLTMLVAQGIHLARQK